MKEDSSRISLLKNICFFAVSPPLMKELLDQITSADIDIDIFEELNKRLCYDIFGFDFGILKLRWEESPIDQVQFLTKEIQNLQQQMKTLQANLSQLELDKSKFTSENKTLTSENATFKSTHESLISSNAELTSENKTLTSENATLQSTNKKTDHQ